MVKILPNKFKILYLTYHPEIGGGEIILLSLLAKLDRKIFDPIVVVTQKGQLSQRLKELKIKTYILPLNGYLVRTFFVPGISLGGIFKFLRLAKKVKPNLIHLNHLNLAIYAGIVGKILKVPVVATAHGTWDCIYFYQDFVNNFFVDKIFANTPKVAANIAKRKIFNRKKVTVIPFGVDINKFKPGNKRLAKRILGLSSGDFVVSIVGRLDPVKDHLNFLKAAEIVNKKYSNIIFYIVGSTLGDFSKSNNTFNKIQNFLKENANLAKNVIFGGFIEDVPKVYQASDILVSSSTSESFGLALVEASACEIPVIATNTGGQSLIVKDNITGYLVKPERPDLLAKRILRLTKDSKLRQKFGENGRKFVTSNFTIENYVSRIEKKYLSLVYNN